MCHPVLETAWPAAPRRLEQNVEKPRHTQEGGRRRQQWRHETERNMLLALSLASLASPSYSTEFNTVPA